MARIQVGMINWERVEFVERSARAVAASLPPDGELTVFDNGSKERGLRSIYERLESDGIRVQRHPRNDGLDPAQNLLLNQFFSDPETEQAFLLEDGCLVMPWTLDAMRAVLDSAVVPPKEVEDGEDGTAGDPEPVGVVGCSLTAGPPCQVFEYLPSGWIDVMIAAPEDGSPWHSEILPAWSPHPTEAWRTIEAPDPFLWGLTRRTWESVGEVDKAFWMGWGTLNDYCYRARLRGIHAAVAWDGFAITWDRHVDRPWAANNPEYRNEWMGRGIGRMGQKWGGGGGKADIGWLLCQSNFREYVCRRVDGEEPAQ